MSHALVDDREPPLLDERTARDNVDTLRRIGDQHGISALRFASPGRLVGHVDEDRDMIDIADFTLDVIEALDRYAHIYSDRVLTKPNVSPDPVAAQPL